MENRDNILWSRHELKYLVTESQAAGIVNYIKSCMLLDQHSEYKKDNAYLINSLYLDSEDLRFYRDSLDGQKARVKLRVRCYDNNPNSLRFFEIKRRLNRTIIKSRARVVGHQAVALLEGTQYFEHDDSRENAALDQFLFYKNSVGAQPLVRIRYFREAYESTIDERVRITFDRKLAFNVTQTPDFLCDGPGWQPVVFSRNDVILEIKFTGYFPAWVNRLVRFFGIRDQSVSKYALSLQQSSVLGYCRPRRTVFSVA